MSRKRHRSANRPLPPQKTMEQAFEGREWPFRKCDFGSGDGVEVDAAASERFHREREKARKAFLESGEEIPEDYRPGSAYEVNLQRRRASFRAGARAEFSKRGEQIPLSLAETPEERASVRQTLASFHQEFEALRAVARNGFEGRGLEVPEFLKPRAPSASLEAELERVVADIAALPPLIAGIKTDTERLRSEAAAMRLRFDSSPSGQEISRLRSESRQMISNILQLDADTARNNRNAGLLLSYCDYHLGSRPANLPPPEALSRYSTDLAFLDEQCRRVGFEVPSSVANITELSAMVRSQVPPQLSTVKPAVPETAAANLSDEIPAHRRSILRSRRHG